MKTDLTIRDEEGNPVTEAPQKVALWEYAFPALFVLVIFAYLAMGGFTGVR